MLTYLRIAFCVLAFSAPAGFVWAEEGGGIHPLDSRGAYLGGGISGFFWEDLMVTGAGGEDYLVEYDDSQGLHAIWGHAYVSRFLRFRYEWEGYRHEVDLTIVEREANVDDVRHMGGKANVTGGGVNLFYDFPALFSGHLAPYVGGGGFVSRLEMEIPGTVSPPTGDDDGNFVEDLIDDTLSLSDYSYGYYVSGGFRIELTSLIGIDVSGRLLEMKSGDGGDVAFWPEEVTEARVSLIVRF